MLPSSHVHVQWGLHEGTATWGSTGVDFPISFNSGAYSVITGSGVNALTDYNISASGAAGNVRHHVVYGNSVYSPSTTKSSFVTATYFNAYWVAFGK